MVTIMFVKVAAFVAAIAPLEAFVPATTLAVKQVCMLGRGSDPNLCLQCLICGSQRQTPRRPSVCSTRGILLCSLYLESLDWSPFPFLGVFVKNIHVDSNPRS
jgi:hypothetical protein